MYTYRYIYILHQRLEAGPRPHGARPVAGPGHGAVHGELHLVASINRIICIIIITITIID